MPHNRIIRILNGIVLQEELIAILAHLLDIRREHTVNCLGEGLNGIARAPEAVAVLLGYRAGVAVRVGAGDDRFVLGETAEQSAWVVRDGEAIIQEYQPHIARTRQSVIILLRQTLQNSNVWLLLSALISKL